jgi:hypothetical protein
MYSTSKGVEIEISFCTIMYAASATLRCEFSVVKKCAHHAFGVGKSTM